MAGPDVNGVPQLFFIKTQNDGSGTVEPHVDTYDGAGHFKRAGDAVSDFSPGDGPNGTWQMGEGG